MLPKSLDSLFGALADPTRRAIIARLSTGEATVSELARPFQLSQPTISKHLKVLEHAGLISRGRVAQTRPCRIAARRLAEASQWLDAYRHLWDDSLGKFGDEPASLNQGDGGPSNSSKPT